MAVHTLNITKSGNGSGTVTSDIGIPNPVDCGDTCTVFESIGTTVTLTATPSRGSEFVRWTGYLTSSSNPVSYVQAVNPTNINAEFRRVRRHRKPAGIVPPQPYVDVPFEKNSTPYQYINYGGYQYENPILQPSPDGVSVYRYSLKPSNLRPSSILVGI